MAEQETTIWGIHAGKTGELDTFFLKKGLIAVGWDEIGDLSKLKPDREAFKIAVAAAYPKKKPGAIPNNAGQLYRFAIEIRAGDLVAYPSRQDRNVHLGKIQGKYLYDKSQEAGYPHRRSVKWLKGIPRQNFSQGALYEIGSAMSLFQVKNYADEFRAALEGKKGELPVSDADTGGPGAEEIEEQTRDFVLKRLAQDLKGHPMTDFVAHLLGHMGYRTRVSPPGQDGGIDIVAHRDELGFEPPFVKVQVKSGSGTVGDPQVKALYGNVENEEKGLFVTLADFSSQARNFARTKSNLRLINGKELVDLIFEHYDDLDSRYKGLLPLKRVFVPEIVKDEE